VPSYIKNANSTFPHHEPGDDNDDDVLKSKISLDFTSQYLRSGVTYIKSDTFLV